IQRVADIVGEIAEASREQSRGLAQINSAVTNLDDVTQQNAALVEETSAASSALQEQARQLAAMASRFVLDGSASVARAAPVAAPRGPASLGRSALSDQSVDTPALA
ncbi:MAG: methyl-accepting chemotaxis protein, partial [Comamonas sp.]|nr:methyl-accepting chemotaxis protein [Comamonas sp.]